MDLDKNLTEPNWLFPFSDPVIVIIIIITTRWEKGGKLGMYDT